MKEAAEQELQHGLQQGIEKRNIDIVKNMLKNKFSFETISDITGLSY